MGTSDVEIQGELTEHGSRFPGSVVLKWTLTRAPDGKWLEAFDATNVGYSGPGVLDFQNIAPPEVSGTSVRWTVPTNLKGHARQYIDQRIDHANGGA